VPDISYGARVSLNLLKRLARLGGESSNALFNILKDWNTHLIEMKFDFARGGGTNVLVTHTVKEARDWYPRIGVGWRQAFKALDAIFTRPESSQ